MRSGGLILGVVLVGCATLAEPAGGDKNLPTSGAGPFRKLTGAEVPGGSAYVLDSSNAIYRQPSALSLTTGVALYVVMQNGGHDGIARTRADDGRAFYGATEDVGHQPKMVLAADQPWEAADLSHPSVVAVSGEVWLYYASNGSIGLARSSDGLAFTKVGAPVLAPDTLGPIDSASVAQLPGGSFDMMFAQGDSLYEAVSADGVTWQRVSAAPVLAPGDGSFDSLRVATPCLAPHITAAGRLQLRVFYTGYAPTDAGVTSAIGFAARYGTEGPLARSPGAVYSVGRNESSPAVWFPGDGSTLLYVDQDQTSSGVTYRAIAGAIAPPTLSLPLPAAFPTSP